MKTRQSTSTSATPKKRKRRVTVTMKSRTSKRTSRVIKTETSPRLLSSAPKKPIVSRKSVAASSDNQVQLALDRLHTSSVPDWLPCRDKEYSAIANFVESTLRSGSSGCMYVSGVPGTGKTACCFQTVRTLQKKKKLPAFKYIEVNGMKLSDPSQLFVVLHEEIFGRKASSKAAVSALEKYFIGTSKSKPHILLLVDELDMLCTTKRQSVLMYQLFEWPAHSSSKLIILAIANTLDLPERMLAQRASSRMGTERISYNPYTFQQLEEILQSRLEGIEGVAPEAMQLISRKVAAVSGDARRALELCRRAAEIASSELKNGFPKAKSTYWLTIQHVNAALKELHSSPRLQAIRCASFYERLFMHACVSEFHRTGVEELVLHSVHYQLSELCRIEGYEPLSFEQACLICESLSALRLIVSEASRQDFFRKLRLNLPADDVMFALRSET